MSASSQWHKSAGKVFIQLCTNLNIFKTDVSIWSLSEMIEFAFGAIKYIIK